MQSSKVLIQYPIQSILTLKIFDIGIEPKLW